MEKYLVPPKPAPENPKPPKPRRQWKRSVIELNGKLDPKYRHDLSALLIQSYSEVGAFPHVYHIDGKPCQTHITQINNPANAGRQVPFGIQGISAVDFDNKALCNMKMGLEQALLEKLNILFKDILESKDTYQMFYRDLKSMVVMLESKYFWPGKEIKLEIKGIYLVSVTKSGCLTVHDFETLYCQSNDLLSCAKEDENKHLLHICLQGQLDAVRWNLANQDEVVCTSMESDEALIFDIGYISSKPVEVLRARRTLSVLGSAIHKGLCDIAFTTADDSRLIASDTRGLVSMWDRRMSVLPCLELTTGFHGTLNSIQSNVENQTILGAGKDGIIFMWDIRGGRTSAAFQCHKEVYYRPLASFTLASLLEKIGSLKAQSDIAAKEIHSIDLDPSCPYQLAFHLDDGWSGVLDIYSQKVTHVHCPPPAWLNGSSISADLLCLRRPSWLPTSSMYVVGSSSENGIHILDFYPDTSSPSHVDYNDDSQSFSELSQPKKQNRFIPLSDAVTACAVHPLNGTIIAGTKNSSLLLVSQRPHSF